MSFHTEVAVVDVRHGLLDMVGRETCQKAQSARVDADDGNFLLAHTACHIQKRAVTTHAHHIVGSEVVVLDELTIRHMNLQVVAQEKIECFGHGEFRFPFRSDGEEFLHGSTLPFLMHVAKEGKLQLFSHI